MDPEAGPSVLRRREALIALGGVGAGA
ncbi:MAG: hypothetical protein JWN32_2815, partial [Solirubrobacterales bacterium]|nr:hypothetical protein [Solirubrobacterales bacterium]